MFTWDAVALVAALFAGSGALVDRLLLSRQKSKLQLALTNWWVQLDETKTLDLLRVLATTITKRIDRLSRSRSGKWKIVVITLALSAALTTAAIFFGGAVEQGWSNAISLQVTFFSNPSLVISAYTTNLIFDTATIAITILIVQRIARLGAFRAIVWLLADLTLAGVLAVACNSALIGAVDIFVLGQAPEWKINHLTWWKAILVIIDPSNPNANPGLMTYAFYSLTTFVPSLVFVSSLLILGFAKPMAVIGRGASKHVLEKATEGQPEHLIVFTMFGSLLGVLGLFAKMIHQFSA